MRLIDADLLLKDIDSRKMEPRLFVRLINDQPTVDVVPVTHGRWITYTEHRMLRTKFSMFCSNCNSRNGLMIRFNYCPNCGAKMDLDEVEE